MTIPTTVHQQQQTPSASFGRNVCCVLALRRLGEAVTSSELGQKARAKSGISDGFSRVLVAKTILCIIFSLGIFWIVVHIVAWRAHRDGAHGLLAPFWAALTAEDLGAQQLQIQQQEEASNFSVTEVDTSAEQSPDDDATAHAAQPPEQGQAEETGANQQPPPPPLHQIFQSAPFTPQGSAGSTLRQPSAQAGASSLPAAPSKVATPQPSGVSTSSAPGSDVSSADDADGNSERPDGDSSSPRDIAADPIAIVSEANPSSPIADESPESDAVADADSTSSPTVDGSHGGIIVDAPESPVNADSNSVLGSQAPAGGINDSITPDPCAHADDADGNHNAEHDALAQNLVAQPPSVDGSVSIAPDPNALSAANVDGKSEPSDGDSTATHDIDQDPIVIVAETKPPLTITAENPESSAVAGETNITLPIVDGSHGGIIVDAPESPVNADSNSVLGSQAPAGGINDSITPDSGAPQVIANPGQIATTQSGGSDSNAPDPGVSSAASGDGNHNSEPDALAQNLVAQAAADGIGDSNAPGSGVPASDGAGKPKPTDGDSTAPHGVDPNSTAIGGETNPPPTITAENPESSAVTDETNTTSPIVDGSHENIVADAHESPVAADSNSDLGAQPPAVDGSVSITPDPSAHADDADGNHNAEHDALAQNLVAQALAGSVNDSSTSSLAGSSQVIVNPGQIATPPSDGNDSSAPDPGVSSAVSGDGSHNPGPDALTQNLGAQPPTGGANDSSTPNSDVSSAASSADKPKSPDGDSTAPQDAIAPDQAVLVAEADSPLTIDDESPESSAVFAIDAAKQCEEAARRIAELNHAAENTHQLLVSDSLTGRTNGNKAQLAALRAAASVISKSLLAESVESFFVKNPCGAVVVLGALTVLDSKKVNEKKACAYILEFILHILREPSGEALSAIAPLLPACLVAKDHISADAISALCFGELLKNGSLSFLNGMHTNANIALSLDHEGGAKFLEELARTLPSELLKASSTERKSAIDNLAVFLSATTPKHAIILRTLIFEALAIVLKAGNNDDASLKHLSHLLNVITEPHDASFPMTCDHAPAKPPTDLVVANQPTGSLASLFGKRERNPELLVRP